MTKKNEITIENFIPKGETALVGRKNGQDCLRKMSEAGIDLVQLENQNDVVYVLIPSSIISMNKSFFLGVWGCRVQALGETVFTNKYNFVTSEHIRSKVKRHIRAILFDARQEMRLNEKNHTRSSKRLG